MRAPLSLVSCLGIFLLASPHAFAEIEILEPDARTGTSAAVVVDGTTALAHTTQLLPLDREGRIVGPGDFDRQVEQVLENLREALAAAGSGLDRIVKLHVYLAQEAHAPGLTETLARTFPGPLRPAAALVVSPLAHPEALVALDAVAAADRPEADRIARRRADRLPGGRGEAHVAVLPPGRALYISGMAAGGSLADATADTMRQLDGVLRYAGLDRGHVVGVKAFLKPMTEASVVREEIARYFDGQTVPPLSLVEWKDGLPIEIELIAAAPAEDAEDEGPVRHLWPPGEEPSPVFSRMAFVAEGPRIYVSGLTARRPGTGEEQVRDIFDRLQHLLQRTGSDLEHMVKATYYVADDDASRALTEVRRELYNPDRPPAASRAAVQGVAAEGRSITIDMIAVPRAAEAP